MTSIADLLPRTRVENRQAVRSLVRAIKAERIYGLPASPSMLRAISEHRRYHSLSIGLERRA